MAYGIIGFSQAGDLNQPSPSIWGDCQAQELLDECRGFFSYQEFLDFPFTASTQIPGIASAAFGHAITSAAQLNDGNFDSCEKLIVGANALDGVAVFTRPLAPLSNTKKLWFEANIAFGAVSGVVQGGFIGFVAGASNQNVGGTITAQAGGLPANVGSAATDAKAGVLAVASATRASNTISTTSLFGFLITPTGPQAAQGLKVDVVYLNQPTFSATPTALPAITSTITAVGTPVYTKLDAMNANSIAFNLPNGVTSQGVIPGDITAYAQGTGSTPAAFAAAAAKNFGFVKFGIRFDGSGIGGVGFLHYYINGVEVARAQVDSTYDLQSDYAPIVSFTGAASGVFYVDFFRAASLIAK